MMWWEIFWCCGRFVGVVGDLLAYWEICWRCGRFVGVVKDSLVRKKKIQPVRPTPALQWTKIESEKIVLNNISTLKTIV